MRGKRKRAREGDIQIDTLREEEKEKTRRRDLEDGSTDLMEKTEESLQNTQEIRDPTLTLQQDEITASEKTHRHQQ